MGTARGPFAALREVRATYPQRRGDGDKWRGDGGASLGRTPPPHAPRVTRPYDGYPEWRNRPIEPAAALLIAAGFVVGVVLFSVYVAPRVAAWLVERGVG